MRRLVRGIVLCGCLAACRQAAPEPHGVTVAGVALGAGPAAVERALGRPDRRQESLGLGFWDYEGAGVSLLWDADESVLRAVVLKKPAAGSLEGMRVGDSAAFVRDRWGEPTRVRQGGRFLDFMRSAWIQTAEVHGGRIVEITVLAR